MRYAHPIRAAGALSVCSMLWALSGCAGTDTPHHYDPERAAELNTQSLPLIQSEQYPEAARLLEESVRLAPRFGEAWNNLGCVRLAQRRLDEAGRAFRRAAELMPSDPEPLNNLGMLYEQVNMFDPAIEAYDQAYALAPLHAEVVANLARARVRRGDENAEVIALLEQVALQDPRTEWQDWARGELARLGQ